MRSSIVSPILTLSICLFILAGCSDSDSGITEPVLLEEAQDLIMDLPASKQNADKKPFVIVEQQPVLIDGIEGLASKIKYPEIAKKAGIEGRVYVQVIVNEDGGVDEATVQRGIGGGADEEAVRVLSQAKFVPGVQRGERVRVKMSIPITFRLQ